MPNEPVQSSSERDDIAKALSTLTAQGQNYMANQPGAREKLIESARELITAAETPIESLLWLIWAQPTRTAAARIAIDLKLFDIALEDGGRPKTAAELAATTGASPKLVERIARSCVSMGLLDEGTEGLYLPNGLTRALAQPEYAAGIIFCFDSTQLSFAKLPAYLNSTNFQNPEDSASGPFQYANKCGHAFGWLTEHPEVFEAFHKYIYALRAHRPSWIDMYPVQDRLVDGLNLEGDASALVDIGGSTGQILEDFRAKVPKYTGRLVLQELEPVISIATAMGLDERIELQVHDFFTPQPVKGARAYFLRSILHDWPDEACRKILGNLKDAMEPGYSRILISDCVVANRHADWQHTSLDLFMMALASSQERTEHEWHKLIESCSLRIVNIHSKGQGNESLIEVAI